MNRWEELFITHNHGFWHLKDVEVIDETPYVPYGSKEPRFISMTVEGTVIKGRSTSRLFQATNTKELEPGTKFQVHLYGKRPYWNNRMGRYELDLTFCG